MSNAKLVTKDDLKEMYQRILPYLGGSADAGFTPIGTIIAVMGNDAPANYLPCDGRVVNISDYPELANYFKEQFGSSNYFGGDGTTTFGIVDLSGEFLRGTGTNSHTNQGSGAEVGVHQDATEIQASQSNNNTLFEYCGNQGDSWNKRYKDADYEVAVANGSYYRVSGTYNEANDAGGITTRPTNTSVLFCIATKNIYLNPSLDFSTSEKVVGTWIDGKPIYQKTISCGALPNATTKNVAHGISNLDRIISFSGVGKNPTSLGQIPIPHVQAGTEGSILDGVFATSTDLVFSTATNRTPISEVYVTLQYIKTTD